MDSKRLSLPVTKAREVAHKWLYLEDDAVIDVMLAVHLANKLAGDPVWMIFIAPPSHAKTELLRSFNGFDEAYFLSSLTPATLVSGWKGKRGVMNASLLPKLSNKTLVVKEFGSILTMRSEDQQQVLSQLREVFDGAYSKAFGNGEEFFWKGKVGFVAASTPAYDSHHGVIGLLGDRFLLYRTNCGDRLEMGRQAVKTTGREKDMRKELKEAVQGFLEQFKGRRKKLNIKTEHMTDRLIALADFAACGRCAVDRDYRTRTVGTLPEPEGPPRLIKQFKKLAIGLAMVQDKEEVDEEIFGILKKIALDLIPKPRTKVLQYLWREMAVEHMQIEWRSSREIAEAIRLPTSSSKMFCEDLMLIGFLDRKQDGEGEKSPWLWRVTEYGQRLLEVSNVFGERVPF